MARIPVFWYNTHRNRTGSIQLVTYLEGRGEGQALNSDAPSAPIAYIN